LLPSNAARDLGARGWVSQAKHPCSDLTSHFSPKKIHIVTIVKILVKTIHTELLSVSLSLEIAVAIVVSSDSRRIRPQRYGLTTRYPCEDDVVLYSDICLLLAEYQLA
jgi:hypothetical protein